MKSRFLPHFAIPVADFFWRAFKEFRAYVLGMIDEIEGIAASAETIHGWIYGDAAKTMARVSLALPADPTIVEIGVWMGRSTVLLASPRRLRGNGRVHCVDPFDCSGDEFSVRHYRNEMKIKGASSLEDVFRKNIQKMKLEPWIEVHKGTSREVAARWTRKIDLLLLDADQTAAGAREAYDLWVPFLKKGGTIILSNTLDSTAGHEGNHLIAMEELASPRFSNVLLVGNHKFAVKEF